MFYDRKIKYLEDRIDGERIRAAGFVKAEVRDELCRIRIHVAGLHETDTFEKTVFVLGGEREGKLCKIKIVEGKGDTGELRLHSGQLSEAGVSYEELEEIRIPLAAGRELRCMWKEKASGRAGQSRIVAQQKEEAQREAGGVEADAPINAGNAVRGMVTDTIDATTDAATNTAANAITDAIADAAVDEAGGMEADAPINGKNVVQNMMTDKTTDAVANTTANVAAHTITNAAVDEAGGVEADAAISIRNAIQNMVTDRIDATANAAVDVAGGMEADITTAEDSAGQYADIMERKNHQPLENKWEQLSAIYPHIAPFGDERDYLSLGPEDFVIFPARYYQLVNNSFLLHGYHNYNHLILTRIVHRGEIRYYIGVPGNYYEKEKQVAIMFGFESFECKTEPAQSGDYGYYMMRIEV